MQLKREGCGMEQPQLQELYPELSESGTEAHLSASTLEGNTAAQKAKQVVTSPYWNHNKKLSATFFSRWHMLETCRELLFSGKYNKTDGYGKEI